MSDENPKTPGAAPAPQPAASPAPGGPAPSAPPAPAAPGAQPRQALDPKAAAALAAFEEQEKKAAEEKKEEEEKKLAAGTGFNPLAMVRGFFTHFFHIRNEPRLWGKAFMSLLFLGIVLGAWFWVTRGARSEDRIVSAMVLGSPEEVFGSFPALWQDSDGNFSLLRHLMASLSRVLEGFLLAALIGVPLGILCGTFKRIDAFFAPISIFGRNVPISALVPLTLLWFGIGESQKVGFIFISCVFFIMFDAARAVSAVQQDYLDTAYTLGASRRQVLTKVLIPLSMPEVFNTLRLMFGLAFGYIILAEAINADEGVGKMIMTAQRRGPREHVYLILLAITLVAFALDRALFAIQRGLFPYRYGRR
jgi:ABC-type nitrate/sulfonate/bicarbonate transport system permease component